MAIAKKIKEMQASSSFIRKMFETGGRLKAEFGAENVFDYSLGNPFLTPPAKVTEVLLEEAAKEFCHGYMPNVGYPETRDALAAYVAKQQGVTVRANQIVVTCGAGGALNVILKTLLNPGDKVLVSTPYFVEYGFYCDNHGGKLETVDCLGDFDLNPQAFASKIDQKTAAVIVNSPNNPSGKIYSQETLEALALVLEEKGKEFDRTIYLISDEPYSKISYDGMSVPPLMSICKNTIICTSFSKDLSLAGERIGYLAVSPETDDFDALMSGCALCNRILGYVNAPALMQRVIARTLDLSVDINLYQAKRDRLYSALTGIGFEMEKPEGAFYLFPKAPGGDDTSVVDIFQAENILAVPGRGFGLPGYFRLSYCVSDEVIERSIPAFERAFAKMQK